MTGRGERSGERAGEHSGAGDESAEGMRTVSAGMRTIAPDTDVRTTPGEPRPRTPRELQQVILTERQGEPFLLHRDGDGALVVTELAGNVELLIGRDGKCDITLDWDRWVSGAHCQLVVHASEWSVEDDGLSRNGTFVNEVRLVGRRRLRDDDVLKVGNTLVRYRDPAGAEREPTALAAEMPEVGQLTDAQRSVLVALCRPLAERHAAAPASNPEISAEVFLGLDAVKWHLRRLFARFGLSDLPQNEKRARLAELALEWGIVTERDLAP